MTSSKKAILGMIMMKNIVGRVMEMRSYLKDLLSLWDLKGVSYQVVKNKEYQLLEHWLANLRFLFLMKQLLLWMLRMRKPFKYLI
jgi:hypothetical protein